MSTLRKIAFVTSEADPNLISDDKLAIEPLLKLGIEVEILVWDRPTNKIEHLDYLDGIIFRSCWNYHKKHEQFMGWLNSLRSRHVPVFNSVDINLWNLSKKYLLDLELCGVCIPETVFIPAGTFGETQLSFDLSAIPSDKIVVKPAVSLNGEDTYLIEKADTEGILKHSAEINKTRDLLLQQFIPEIQSGGELSLIFFNKKFSHAIQKTAKAGEFRIHEEHGGSRRAYTPTAEVLKFASDVVSHITDDMLFCRVDLVQSGKKIYLIELEILDPMLFLGMDPGAPARFADAISSVLDSGDIIFM
jgi:glutathione synthase/RimK-type ligase-like ATP-grasp enzyme